MGRKPQSNKKIPMAVFCVPVELDRTKCMLRQTYRVDKMGVFFTWRGVRLENCNIRFARDVTQSEAICVNVLILNISKGHCPPDIEMLPGSSGPSFQVTLEAEHFLSPR